METRFREGKLTIGVPDEMVDNMLSLGEDFELVETREGLKRITELQGHNEFHRDKIKILQLAWLVKNRKIDYMFFDERYEWIAIGIEEK